MASQAKELSFPSDIPSPTPILATPGLQDGLKNQQIENFIYSSFQGFEPHQRYYIKHFTRNHAAVLSPHHRHRLIKPTQEVQEDHEHFQNVAEHCVMSGIYAAILSDELGLSPNQKDIATTASMLHDFSKRNEIEQTDPLIREGSFTLDAFQKIKTEDQILLQKYGFSEEVSRAAGANTLEDTKGPQDDAGKIVWFVDAMLYDTTPVAVKERLEKGRTLLQSNGNGQRGKRNQIMSDIMKEKLGGVDYYDAQEKVGEGISKEFAERILLHKLTQTIPTDELLEAASLILKPETLPHYLHQQFEIRTRKVAELLHHQSIRATPLSSD